MSSSGKQLHVALVGALATCAVVIALTLRACTTQNASAVQRIVRLQVQTATRTVEIAIPERRRGNYQLGGRRLTFAPSLEADGNSVRIDIQEEGPAHARATVVIPKGASVAAEGLPQPLAVRFLRWYDLRTETK